MTGFVTTCKECGKEYQPSPAVIRDGTWLRCPDCLPKPTEEIRCRECGRLLRATTRDICLSCVGFSVS
jgi:hypothetical protein